MQFHIDQDTGDSIRGWVIYDNPTAVPVLSVRLQNGEEFVFEANENRTDMKDLGRHTTGQCGFNISTQQIGESIRSNEIEIFDTESDTLLYRRTNLQVHIQQKIIFFEPSALSIRRLYVEMSNHFAISYEHAHNFPFEIAYSLLSGKYSNSMLLFGHLPCARYQPIASSENFKTFALLRDPMSELAERLLFAKHIAANTRQGTAGHSASVNELAPFVEDVDFKDQKSLNTLMRQLRIERLPTASNPLTRALSCVPGEPVERRHVGVALDMLARMDAVGTRDRVEEFSDLVSGLLGSNIMGNARPERYPMVEELTTQLYRITSAIDLLEHDLAIYDFLNDALSDKSPAAAP